MNASQTPWDFNVYIVTWNVGSKYPETISLDNLLGVHTNNCPGEGMPDMYAIGLQEVNSQPQNQVLGLFKDDPWTIKFKEVLKDSDYVAVKTEQMQGLMLTLFAKRKHVPHLRNIEAEFTRTGFGGIWGNKGAVSIRLSVYGCGVVFLAAHLAAHDHELAERIEDYKQILGNHHYHVERYREIFDHEYVFWFGDLNFRLTGDDTPEEVQAKIEADKLDELIERDQLNLVRETHKAFHHLVEKTPAFPPTFKFKENTSTYDLKRRPAWTDRILYTVHRDKYPDVKLNLNQLSYKSHPGYNISDHKPVTSEFVIKIFNNPDELFIEFHDIGIWHLDEENVVEYYKPPGFVEEDHDWIGIYRNNYASFGEYKAYQYVNQANLPANKPHSSTYFRNRVNAVNSTTMRIHFAEEIHLNEGETYLLIYFQNTGIRGVTSVAGVSNVFKVEKRPPTPSLEQVD